MTRTAFPAAVEDAAILTIGEPDWLELETVMRVGRETLVRAGERKPTSDREIRQAAEGPCPVAFYDCRRHGDAS